MMPLGPLQVILYILIVVAIGEPILIYYAHRSDKNSRGKMQATSEGEDARGDLAVPTVQRQEDS